MEILAMLLVAGLAVIGVVGIVYLRIFLSNDAAKIENDTDDLPFYVIGLLIFLLFMGLMIASIPGGQAL